MECWSTGALVCCFARYCGVPVAAAVPDLARLGNAVRRSLNTPLLHYSVLHPRWCAPKKKLNYD